MRSAFETTTFLLIAALLPAAGAFTAEKTKPSALIAPRKTLFKHETHLKYFEKLEVGCTDCHTFSIKPKTTDPAGKGVQQKLLQPGTGLCHSCHLGKVKLPIRSQCSLCHQERGTLKPKDHSYAWKIRHGKIASNDRDACAACHTQSDCTGCHVKQNTMMPMVHRPNFRLSHSIQARQNPASCVSCHKRSSFCLDCHSGGK